MRQSKKPANFFSREHQQRLIAAIIEAESKTSGEIRVHLERRSKGDPAREAEVLFDRLGMADTGLHNGVLIYMTIADRRLVILGDEGIDEKVGPNFWDEILQSMIDQFKQDRFIEGLEKGIVAIGEKLAEYFPRRAEDINELSNEISTGE